MIMRAVVDILLCIVCVLGVVSGGCHPGWLHFEQSCYLFSDQKTTWYSAASSCREHNSKLAEVETQTEVQFLKLEAKNQRHSFWLGGRDDVVEGQWEWSSGIPIKDVTDWVPGEPSNTGDQDCLKIRSGSHYQWDDATCDAKLNFICEQGYSGDESVIG